MLRRLLKNDTTRFLILFAVLYGVFYAFNYAYTGLTAPGGSYWPWLDEHLDYISALRSFTLHGASWMLSLFGYDNYVYEIYLRVIGMNTVRMVYSCIGLNIIALWWAFIISFPQPVKRKIVYFISGTVIFILLNMIRVALVAIAPRDPRILNMEVDHHDIFNVIVYGIIILVIFRIINKSTKRSSASAS